MPASPGITPAAIAPVTVAAANDVPLQVARPSNFLRSTLGPSANSQCGKVLLTSDPGATASIQGRSVAVLQAGRRPCSAGAQTPTTSG